MATETKTAPAPAAFDVKEVGAEPPKTRYRKEAKPNPLHEHVADALNRGVWKSVATPDDNTLAEARKLVRRAARELDSPISMRTGDGTLHFGPKPTR